MRLDKNFCSVPGVLVDRKLVAMVYYDHVESMKMIATHGPSYAGQVFPVMIVLKCGEYLQKHRLLFNSSKEAYSFIESVREDIYL